MRRAILLDAETGEGNGLIDGRSLAVTYQTSQPDASRWVAVGTLWQSGRVGPGCKPLGLLVGEGRSERAAIVHLGCRLAALEDASNDRGVGVSRYAPGSCPIDSSESLSP
jgi:hypothetical protein